MRLLPMLILFINIKRFRQMARHTSTSVCYESDMQKRFNTIVDSVVSCIPLWGAGTKRDIKNVCMVLLTKFGCYSVLDKKKLHMETDNGLRVCANE